ncbi:hypothetical protein KPP03845_100370 [Streptomyces xanthophaeus]|nr:hypothetical protein KPP03845_100370 [Streptomyces xanthophaeus]
MMTVTARRELVSPVTRNAFRPLATAVSPEQLKYSDPGQRWTESMRYAEGVDWTDQTHVRRALMVFEDYIRVYRDPEEQGTPKWLDDIKVRLDRDGYALSDRGSGSRAGSVLTQTPCAVGSHRWPL